ncbi:MAG: protein-glutamate O-methyltransferase CheR [Verrucomicrobiota bacterium]|jgi:chemotaxis protein methyltransferase CheR
MRTAAAEREACRYLGRLIQDRCGIQMQPGKEALIKARLGRRMRQYGLKSLSAYCDFLREQEDEEELAGVVDALTIHFTNFLREQEHFQFMVEEALPVPRERQEQRFHVWSAASSSGEEAYTIGMYLAEHSAAMSGCDWRVSASDVSAKMLEKARLGVYTEERVRTLPRQWVRKYFQRGVGNWEGHYRVKRLIADRITFRQINLMEDYSHTHAFDMIFLRNVLIYLDRSIQEQLVRRVCQFLAPQGHLLIGHSENLTGLNVPLRSLRPSIYQHNLE